MTQIGKYMVVRELGHGGMGVVYEAHDPVLDRSVAVKLVKGPGDPERFLREARAAAKVIHANCVPIFDMGEHAGSPFLVMELVVGMSASEFVECRGPLPPRLATDIVASACRGLEAIHSAGIVHRDIKPSNLLLSRGGSVKVADFGLARVAAGNAPTLTGDRVVGTPMYMSPEQCHAEPADARSDIYSLGATYYVLLTNQPPFRGQNELQIMFAHCNDPIPDPRKLVPEIPEACADVVRKAMAKNPADRYQTTTEMLAALDAIRAADPSPTMELAGLITPPSAAPLGRAESPTRTHTSDWPPRTEVCDVKLVGTPQQQSQATPARSRRRLLLGIPVLACGLLLGYFALFPATNETPGDKPDQAKKKDDEKRPASTMKPPVGPPILVELREVGGTVGTSGVAVSDDGRWLAVALTESHAPAKLGGVKLFDRTDGPAPELWWKWRDDACNAVAFSPDGKLLAAGFSGTSRLRIWNLSEDKEIFFRDARFEGEASGGIVGLAFSQDGKLLAASSDGWGTHGGRIRVWNVSDGTKIRDLIQPMKDREPTQPIRGVSFASDSKTLAAAVKMVAGSQPFIDIWEADAGKHIKSIALTQATLGPCVSFARNEPLLAYSTTDDIETARAQSFDSTARMVTGGIEPAALALSPDGRLLAVSQTDSIHLLDLTGKEERHTLKGQVGQIYSLTFTADGKTLISGSENRTVREWPIPPRK